MTVTTCVFDAYGTLFDVTAAARACAEEPGREEFAAVASQLAQIWRLKQLQYSWLRAAAGVHCSFWQVTRDGLDFALEAVGLADPALRRRLMDLYMELGAYPEAAGVLQRLKAAGRRCAILSNGSPDMLQAAIASAGLGDLLDAVLSAESVGVFKPDRRVYELVGRQFGCAAAEVLFVSSNGWDAAAAAGFGFRSVWVNRAGEPIERLPWRPDHEIGDLTGVPALAGVA